MEKQTKDARIYLRIDKDIKDKFMLTLKDNGDDMSGFLTRTIVKYINSHQDK